MKYYWVFYNSQYFWINTKDLEIETKRNWQAIFDKCKDLSTEKYRKELAPNITFQPNKIFVRNDLFEKIIKSCEATNLEFLKLKEKLGLCLYEDICDEQELISMSEVIFKEENFFTQHDVKDKQSKEGKEKLRNEENEKLINEENDKLRNVVNEKLRNEENEKLINEENDKLRNVVNEKLRNEENEKLRNEENEKLRKEENEKLRKEENEKLRKKNEQLRKENEQLRKNNVVQDATIKKPIEIKRFKEDKNMADNCFNWFDRNKFENILAITDSNKFNYKNKISKFRYINI